MVGILKMDSGIPNYGLQFPRGHPGCVEVRDSVEEAVALVWCQQGPVSGDSNPFLLCPSC